MSDEEKQKLLLYKKYIVETLQPSYIQDFMVGFLGKAVSEQISSLEENKSAIRAADLFLDKVCQLDQLESPGWYRALLDALRSAGYTGLYEALEQSDFTELERLKENKHLLGKLEPSLRSNFNASQLLPHLQDCLMERDCEAIRNREAQKGDIAAAALLIQCLMKTDCVSWFKLLKTALSECEFFEALRLLDPDDESLPAVGKEEDSEEKLNVTETTLSIQYREDSDEEDGLLKSVNQLTVEPGTTAAPPADSAHKTGEKKLRKYQSELAQPVYDGKNTIICAPTGCGKTVVALAISEHHLENRGQGSKVLFMATKVDVYNQQLQLFTEYFSDTDVRIQGICGGQGDQLSLSVVVETNDIIVLTPQIVVNALMTNDIKQLSCFSLLIFDECHNTTGKHPYNIIMSKYLDSKLDRTGGKLPQIVGLTASVGIGNFKDKEEAITNICQLCANLNTEVISTVEENVQELRSFVHTPEKDFRLVEERKGDPFIRVIKNLMGIIENEAKSVYDIGKLSSIQNSDYGSQKYEQWIVDVQQKCRVLILEDKQQESQVCRALYNYTEHLRRYNDALIIHEDARTKDALEYLCAFMEEVKQAGNDSTETQLTQYFDGHVMQLRDLATGSQHENPKLEDLKYILEEQYRMDPDTKTVLFVRTRALADALRRWMEETECLKHLKPKVLIGRGKRSQLTTSGHMTLNDKKGVLDSFKSSSNQSKLLIATSVADEGIDLPQCNLVIMYEYVGNVVKMIQVRGRGRAKDSVCILVSNKKERIYKEKMNMQKEKIVETAVRYIQNQDPQELHTKICVLQRTDRLQRQQKRVQPVRQEGDVILICGKCRKTTACSSDDIRVLQDCHHIVLDRSLFSRSKTRPHPQPKSFDGLLKTRKLSCGNCNHDWGIVATFANIPDLPVLKIESFVVEDRRTETKRLLYFRKWKEVNFTMKPFNISDVPSDWTPWADMTFPNGGERDFIVMKPRPYHFQFQDFY